MITSAQNPLLKAVRKALARGGLTADGRLAAETPKLFEEALRGPARVTQVLCEPRYRDLVANALTGEEVAVREVEPALLAAAASTKTSPGIITIAQPKSWEWAALTGRPSRLLIADGIQDPGNLGTILRAAEAFDATGLVALKGAVSPWNPKAVRGSAGSVFRVPLRSGVAAPECAEWLREQAITAVVADAREGTPAHEYDWSAPTALVLGSEAAGPASAAWASSPRIRIPMQGVESLNVAIAAAVLLYEAQRR